MGITRPRLLSILCLLALCARAEAASVADVFSRVKDSVVVIQFVERTPSPDRPGVSDRIRGNGSGVYVGERRILTASHVVQVADEVKVEFTDGEVLTARGDAKLLLGGDVILSVQGVPLSDPDLLKGARTTLRTLKSGDELRLGVLRAGRTLELKGLVP